MQDLNIPLYKKDRFGPVKRFAMLTVVAFLVTRPNSWEGAAIAAATMIPVLIFWLALISWWSKRFAGSKLMELLFFLILAVFIFWLRGYLIPLISPYVGGYFA